MTGGKLGLFKRLRISVRYFATLGLVTTTIAVPTILLQSRNLASATNLRQSIQKPVSVPSNPTSSKGLIFAGPSRKTCVELPKLPFINGAFPIASGVKAFEKQTGTSISCLTEYVNGALNWKQWEDPYITAPYAGVTTWVAANPQNRQLVVQVDLIPLSLKNINNPLGWEQSCAAGQFNSYAHRLGMNLVGAGLQNSVIRLGAEMNGPWETDFIGTTTKEQKLWATCFSNEVTALRKTTGEHFLIDWNPNSCFENIPLKNFYPGNSHVDILGLDLYDVSCASPTTPVTWTRLANLPAGLVMFEAFANEHHKPMSFPEWGLFKTPKGDDPSFVNGIGSTIASQDFAFEGYFDSGNDGTLPIGSESPLSLEAYKKWFS